MISKYSQIHLADEALDALYRKQAIEAFNAVRQKLKLEQDQQEEDFELYLSLTAEEKPFEYNPGILTREASIQGFRASAKILRVKEGKYPLLFAFGTKEKIPNPGIGWLGKSQVVILFNNLIGPFNMLHAATRLSIETFVHEFIHYLDICRRGDPRRLMTPEQRERGHSPGEAAFDYTKYFNTPAEMNAYYQENIDSINTVVDSFIGAKYEPGLKSLENFNDFFKFYSRFMDKNWLNALTPENKKRVQKRFFHFYETVKDKR